MILDHSVVNQIHRKIIQADRILIISHRRPDADTIGANLSLRKALLSMGKEVISACRDEIGIENYFLPDVYVYRQNFGKPEDYDLIITVDCGDSKITEYHKDYEDLFSGKYPIINIDHHVSNDYFGDINLVRADFASTTEILYMLLRHFKVKIDSDMATLLLAGLYYDTGSFKHDNTTVRVLEIAAKLTGLGAKASYIAKNMFRKIPVPTLKVWGKVFERIQINDDKIVSSMVTTEEIKERGGNEDDIKGADLISYINSIPEARFSMLLTEKHGVVKGSFRTSRNDTDVAKIAKKYFQGGGHKKAAGFSVPGKLYINDNRRMIIKEN